MKTGKETIVFVYGIGSDTDENKLWQLFSAFGNIVVSNSYIRIYFLL